MNKRDFLLGLGFGMIIASALSLVGYMSMVSDYGEVSEQAASEAPYAVEGENGGLMDGIIDDNAGDESPQADDAPQKAVVEITDETATTDIAASLKGQGVIEDANAFETYLEGKLLYLKLTPGAHEVEAGDSYDEIIYAITKGN